MIQGRLRESVYTLNPNTALEEILLFWTRAACKDKGLNEVNYYIPCLGKEEKAKGENSTGG